MSDVKVNHMSRYSAEGSRWHVRTAKIQISLRNCTVWSES